MKYGLPDAHVYVLTYDRHLFTYREGMYSDCIKYDQV